MRSFLPFLVLVSANTIAQGQPPEVTTTTINPPEAGPPRPIPPRPGEPKTQIELDLKRFFDALNTLKADKPDIYQDPNLQVAPYLADSRVGYFGGTEWGTYFTDARGTSRYSLDKVEIEKLENASARVKVSYTLTITNPVFQVEGQPAEPPKIDKRPQTEELDLRREFLPWEPTTERWRIVAPQLNEIAADQPLTLRNVAYFAGQRPSTKSLLRAEWSMYNLRQCALGVLQFSQDWDEKLLFENDYWPQAIWPYCKGQAAFVIPGTKDRYTFNDNLSDKDLAAMAEPARTVLFYEGENEKPLFHYDGKAVICFMDGHVKLLTPEQMAGVIWKL